MDRLYALIEQLDLAIDQLVVGTPVAARFALILIDNATELVLHGACEHEVRLDRSRDRSPVLKPKYDVKARQDAEGQRFDRKVAFCRAIGMLSEREARSILIIHSYRNELYHTGIKYDPIILPLAWQYFEFAAGLIREMRVMAWHLVDAVSPRVLKYVPADAWAAWGDGFLEGIADSLVKARPGLSSSVAAQLSAFAAELVDEVDRDLEFLASDNFESWGKQKMLQHVQFQHYAFEGDGRSVLDLPTVRSVSELQARLDSIRENWTPRYRQSPTAGWRRRAASIARSNDIHQALERFQNLRRDMGWLASVLAGAAAELDAAIQHEIDHRLGK